MRQRTWTKTLLQERSRPHHLLEMLSTRGTKDLLLLSLQDPCCVCAPPGGIRPSCSQNSHHEVVWGGHLVHNSEQLGVVPSFEGLDGRQALTPLLASRRVSLATVLRLHEPLPSTLGGAGACAAQTM